MASSLFITHIPSILTLTDLGEMFKKDNLTIIQMESLDTPDRALVTCPDQFVADRVSTLNHIALFSSTKCLRFNVEMRQQWLMSGKRSTSLD